MRISDWSSDVCSSDLIGFVQRQRLDDVGEAREYLPHLGGHGAIDLEPGADEQQVGAEPPRPGARHGGADAIFARLIAGGGDRSEEHTSELQSLMRISYAVFCLKKKKKQAKQTL